MKLTAAWAEVVSENMVLKIAGGVLALLSIMLMLGLVRLSLRPPLVIERACYSRAVTPASPERTVAEAEAFIHMALALRFNSDATLTPGILAPEEASARAAEQHELTVRGMTQRVFVNAVKLDGERGEVDVDRVISVGAIRSAFVFPLVVRLATTTRSESNPYGLELAAVGSPKKEDGKK